MATIHFWACQCGQREVGLVEIIGTHQSLMEKSRQMWLDVFPRHDFTPLASIKDAEL